MTKKKTRATVVVILLSLVAAIIFSLISVSLAYFRFFMDKSGVNSVMVELIFDHLDFNTAQTKEKLNAAGFFDVDENGNEIRWGSKENPYVISQKYHVQNLAVLQNSGFFSKRVGKDADGKEVPEASYFLVCTPQGTAVTVDCQGMTIAPIGTTEYPFTGTIQGAPLSGGETTKYKDNETTLSTIANLRVEAKLDTPDIGFFGTLGYCGEKFPTENDLGEEVISVKGFGAVVQDLILADITVASKLSLKDTLEKWWGELFGGHLNRSEERGETHHVGIIAGHAEFATVKNVSVYYSEDVPAFELVSDASGSNTNYYSTTGLIGLLDHVNPASADGVLDGSNAISDSVLIGDGSGGGGGSESGTMTGYFLAKNLYDRHEATLSAEKITGKYNVTEMKDKDGNKEKALFETVTMREGKANLPYPTQWSYRNYYYFQDTVFTFAMSMSVAADEEGNATETPDESKSDYVQKVWKDLSEDERPSISLADTMDNLVYGFDPSVDPQISYTLTAV